MPLTTDFTYVFAVPGQSSIIDVVRPDDGLSSVYGSTLEEIQTRNPGAILMRWDDFRAAQIARQNTPITWEPSTNTQYWEMLEVLPPAAQLGSGFLVGEPDDHSYATGQPRFTAYRQHGPAYVMASRPLTVAEFRAEMERT